jgi:hypothetical protein
MGYSSRPHYCSTERVWKKPADTAARVALWVRWLAWLLTFGRSGELPWVLENTCGGCWNPEDEPGKPLALPPAPRGGTGEATLRGWSEGKYPPKPPPPPPPPPRRYP